MLPIGRCDPLRERHLVPREPRVVPAHVLEAVPLFAAVCALARHAEEVFALLELHAPVAEGVFSSGDGGETGGVVGREVEISER